MSLLSIQGNIKLLFLPFVLNPNASLNQNYKLEARHVLGVPLKFSFRNTSIHYDNISSNGKLNICPKSFLELGFDDISFKLLYTQDGKSVDLNTFFDKLPGIQIREFLPDTSLDLALDAMLNIATGITKGFGKMGKGIIDSVKNLFSQDEEEHAELVKKQDNFVEKIQKVSKFAVQYLTGLTIPNFYSDSFKNQKIPMGSCNDLGDLTTYIYKFPYTMWYLLLSTTTTNLYELPCVLNSRSMYSSNGHLGWPSAGLSLVDAIPGMNALKNIPIIGDKMHSAVNNIIGNINISFMPWWDAKKGNSTPSPNIEIQFDLFNDSAENALFNFIFVNTIVPNAKWIQYNMFLHSPHLYDVKIEGYERLYACSGSFEVSLVGVLRDMHDKWIDKYLKPRINSCMSTQFIENIKRNRLIKIPDIYHVKMVFTSLLPDTFNNYLFTYSENSNILTEYSYTSRYNSNALKVVSNGVKGFGEAVEKKWDED